MANILLISENASFKEDLQHQIERSVPEFAFESETADIAIVDENKEKLAEVRNKYSAIPIIFLSSENCITSDNLNILLKKPFELHKLIDELLAANNKLDNSVDGYLTFNNYELRPNKREIVDLPSGNTVKLTEKEICIIKYLYKYADRYISKTELQRDVWQYSEEVATHTIETHIYRLRQKVERDESRRFILTNNGGYKLKMD